MDKPYIRACKKCSVQYKRHNNYVFVCNNCKNPKAYPRVFYKNRLIALKRDGNRCQSCGDSKKLIIHHIDCNIKNNSPSNLITLCDQCHKHLHSKYSKKKLRHSNIYKLFPKEFRWGQFGKRPKIT